jgi:hypothetical protein
LSGIRAKVRELQERVAALEESFMKATEDKNAAIAQVLLLAAAFFAFFAACCCSNQNSQISHAQSINCQVNVALRAKRTQHVAGRVVLS